MTTLLKASFVSISTPTASTSWPPAFPLPDHGYDPKTHAHYSVAKNRLNDHRQALYMDKAGWLLLRLWEHDLKLRPEWCAEQIRQHVAHAASQLSASQEHCHS